MFENFRQSILDLMDRATPPEERRAGLAQMKHTLVTARMAVDDLRGGVAATRQKLEAERRELETVQRRKGLAAGISDAETVALAEKYEAMHGERVAMLAKKLDAQESELALVEREVTEMTSQLKAAMAGIAPPDRERDAMKAGEAEADAILNGGAEVASEIDALGRAGARAARNAQAEDALAELKRRMGK